jgi:cell division protein FtsB
MRGVLTISALVAAALVFAWVDGDAGLRAWWGLRGEVAEANERIELLRGDVAARQRDAADLEDDEFAIERAIRERLEYARPGETIVKLRDPSGATRWSD